MIGNGNRYHSQILDDEKNDISRNSNTPS